MRSILFVADSIPPIDYGGIPNVTWNQAKELSKRNRVGIVINSSAVPKNFKREEIEGIDVFTVPRVFPNWMHLSYHYKNFSNKETLETVLGDFRPDILHINGYFNLDVRDFRALRAATGTKVVREVCYIDDVCLKGNLIDGQQRACSGPAAEKCKKCFFESYPNPNANFLKRQIKEKSVPWLLKKQNDLVKEMFGDVFAGVVFPSESFRDFFARHVELKDKSAVVAHGIELPRHKKPAARGAGAVNFGFIGSFHYRKGIGVVLEAFKKLARQKTEGFKLNIWGTRTEEQYARELQRLEAQYPTLIAYKGNYLPQDIPAIARETDAALVPSYTETYCLVVREWLSQGVPCITTNYFGSEIIEDAANGFVIPTGDADELCRKMLKLLDEPETLEKITRGAGVTFIPTVADECRGLEEFYERLGAPSSGKAEQPKSLNAEK